MKNALILHGTAFDKNQIQHDKNWFPWLKQELEKMGYKVWLPELPEPWHPNLNNYWNFLKDFNFNEETILIGHSSGAATVFGLLHKLPTDKKIKLAISVAGFYKDDGWNCERLFEEKFDWKKIKEQAEKICLIYSPDDPYVKPYQTNYLSEKLAIQPIIIPDSGHFSVSKNPKFKQFPELLEIFLKNTSC